MAAQPTLQLNETWPGSDKYEPLKILSEAENGGGQNKGIIIMKRKADGLFVVRKKIEEPKEDTTSARESHILMILRGHSNITRHRDTFRVKDSPLPGLNTTYIVLQLADRGNLQNLYIHAKTGQFENGDRYCLPEEFVWHCFRGMIGALLWMHFHIDVERGYETPRELDYILHRDIKPANIFLSTDNNNPYPRPVLGDFGGAIQYGELMRNSRGNRGVDVSTFFPPETPYFGRGGDIWCLGCTFFEVLGHVGGAMFEKVKVRNAKLNETMIAGDDEPLETLYPQLPWLESCTKYSEELRWCIKQCVTKDYKERPSVTSISKRVEKRYEKLISAGKLSRNPDPLPDWLDPAPEFVQPA